MQPRYAVATTLSRELDNCRAIALHCCADDSLLTYDAVEEYPLAGPSCVRSGPFGFSLNSVQRTSIEPLDSADAPPIESTRSSASIADFMTNYRSSDERRPTAEASCRVDAQKRNLMCYIRYRHEPIVHKHEFPRPCRLKGAMVQLR
jgi:hypothetical protein